MTTVASDIRRKIDSTRILGVLAGITAVALVLGFVGLIIFRILFVNFVDNYELGYKYDMRSGKLTVLADSMKNVTTGKYEYLPLTGYIVSPPFLVKVHTIDLRPMQVCIKANSRVLNCKLVKFDPAGLVLFLSWHGRGDYDNDGTSATPSQFNQILMSYAYDGSGRSYPFLDVLRELKNDFKDSTAVVGR